MSERPEPGLPASGGERAAQDAVRALPRPRAGETFRTRLRVEFTSGRLGARPGVARPAPWFGRASFWVPAAAALLAVAGVTSNQGPDWRLVSANGEGRVSVDGVAYAPGDAALAAHLRRGGRVRVEGALTVDLVAPGVAAVALAPGADAQLSPAPARWWARRMRVHVASGDAYFTTGRAFHGARLDVSTPEVNVRAVGTAFAVLRETGGTCVCVMEGRVHVSDAKRGGADAVEVPEGMRRVVHGDGSAETKPILDESVHRLHAQRTTAGELLGR